nr:hypothetical protein [Tanacetum cinerariifolium]
MKDDVTIHKDDVPIEESKVHSNPLFDNDEINSDELEKKESGESMLNTSVDNDSQREEIDIVTNTNELLPLGFENDDSDGEVDVVEELHVDNSISSFEHELSDDEASDFNNPSIPRPPPKPPDAEIDFELDAEISVVKNTIVEFECLDPRVEFDVCNDDDDYSSF